MSARLFAPVGCLLLLLGGCANTSKDAGFGDVSKLVNERTGQRIHWDQGTDADLEAKQAAASLLQSELTPESAVQIALLSNPHLQATYEDLGVAQAELVRAGLLKNPIFSADAKFVEGGGGTIIELSVVQDFLDILQIPLRKRAAQAEFEMIKLRVSGEAIDLAGRVRTAYYTLQAAEQTRELRQSVVAANEATSDLTRRMREAGNITALAAASARVTYEQSTIDLATADLDRLAKREQLNLLLGINSQSNWKIATRLPDIADDAHPADVEKMAVENSLELRMSVAQMDSRAQALGLQRKYGLMQELQLGAAAEHDPNGDWSFGPAVTFPIPLLDNGQSRIDAARAELRRSERILLRDRGPGPFIGPHRTRRLTSSRAQAIQYRDVIVPLRHAVTAQTQLQVNAMAVGPFELLEAKRQEIEAAVMSLNAQRDYWLAHVEMDQLLAGRSNAPME